MSGLTTRSLIVGKADRLFYEAGFASTSFADIAASVGISRGNFYHHFKSKDEILEAVIDCRSAATRGMLDDWAVASANPRDRILSFVHMLVGNRDSIMAFGCPVGTLSSELAKLKHPAEGRAAGIFTLFRDWLAEELTALGLDAAEDRALHLLAWSQGVAVMAAAFKDEGFMRREVAGITCWLDAEIEAAAPKRKDG